MKKEIDDFIKGCLVCLESNRKNRNTGEFVTTTRPWEKVALDLIDLRNEGKYILVVIDYFSRYMQAKVLDTKDAQSIEGTIRGWCIYGYIPEELITDNDKEFCNEKFRKVSTDLGIKHCVVSVEDHKANGRIERLIRTIRDGIV